MGRSDPNPSFYRILAGALAVALLALGLPQTADSIWRHRIEPGVNPFDLERPEAQGAAAASVPALESLDARLGDPGARVEAGALRLNLPPVRGLGCADPADAAATADLESGLSRLPADDLGWFELALARCRAGDFNGARSALRTSNLFGFFDPYLNLSRTELGFSLWFDQDDLRMLQEEARFAWQSDPQGLVRFAQTAGPGVANVIRGALEDESRSAFEAALK